MCLTAARMSIRLPANPNPNLDLNPAFSFIAHTSPENPLSSSTILNERNETFIPDNCFLKFGTCPPTFIHPGDVCKASEDCFGNRLCCYGGANESRCTDPWESKGYECPSSDQITITTESRKCSLDSDCLRDEKCCSKSSCSYFCAQPVKKQFINTFRQICKPYISPQAQCPGLTTTKILCDSNKDCAKQGNHRICCRDISGNNFCTEPFTTRSGVCPSPFYVLVDKGNRCALDSDCPLNQRCCIGPLGCNDFVCSDVEISSEIQCESIKKIGVCPMILSNQGAMCQYDAECPGNQLCCQKNHYSEERRCSDPFSQVSGFCPIPELVSDNYPACLLDEHCPAGFKCCAKTKCSYFCTPLLRNNSVACGQFLSSQTPICPTIPINPTRYCEMDLHCPKNQLCCSNLCSNPTTSLNEQCPDRTSVPISKSRCSSDNECSANTKCCPDINCDYYCISAKPLH